MTWPRVALGEVCKFKYGKSLPAAQRRSGSVDVFGSNGVVGSHDKALTSGPTIVIGRKGSFGEVCYSKFGCWPIDTTYYIDRKATDVDVSWLARLLATLGLTKLNRAAAVPGLSREDAYRIQILRPPIEEQQRIAEILDWADALRAKRRAAIAHLDDLTQSVFLEMFGDPVSNSAGWPHDRTLGDVSDIASGITKGRKLNGKLTRAVPYLAVANVQAGRLELEYVKAIQATELEVERYRLQDGDLLLTEGGDPDKLGRGTVWRSELPECIHQNHVFRVRLADDGVTSLFTSRLLGTERGKQYFLRSAKQTTGIASINMSQLREFPMLLPPLPLQQAFAERVERIEFLKATHRTHLAQLDELFTSLQQRAFAGQL